MKRLTLHLTFAAAALVVTSATASAQSMKVEIPFAFQTVNARMQPGTYEVSVSHNVSSPVVHLRNTDNNRSILALPGSGDPAPAKWTEAGKAVMEFACVAERCALSRIWTGSGSALKFYPPKAKNGEVVAMILVHPDRTE